MSVYRGASFNFWHQLKIVDVGRKITAVRNVKKSCKISINKSKKLKTYELQKIITNQALLFESSMRTTVSISIIS